jgi:hypothetical protein
MRTPVFQLFAEGRRRSNLESRIDHFHVSTLGVTYSCGLCVYDTGRAVLGFRCAHTCTQAQSNAMTQGLVCTTESLISDFGGDRDPDPKIQRAITGPYDMAAKTRRIARRRVNELTPRKAPQRKTGSETCRKLNDNPSIAQQTTNAGASERRGRLCAANSGSPRSQECLELVLQLLLGT